MKLFEAIRFESRHRNWQFHEPGGKVKGPYLILHKVGLFPSFVFGRHKTVGIVSALW